MASELLKPCETSDKLQSWLSLWLPQPTTLRPQLPSLPYDRRMTVGSSSCEPLRGSHSSPACAFWYGLRSCPQHLSPDGTTGFALALAFPFAFAFGFTPALALADAFGAGFAPALGLGPGLDLGLPGGLLTDSSLAWSSPSMG